MSLTLLHYVQLIHMRAGRDASHCRLSLIDNAYNLFRTRRLQRGGGPPPRWYPSIAGFLTRDRHVLASFAKAGKARA